MHKQKQGDLHQWQPTYLLIAQQLRQAYPHLTLTYLETLSRRLLIRSMLSGLFSPLRETRTAPSGHGSIELIGRIYEQCLGYRLIEQERGIQLAIDQSSRQDMGSYYTPVPVVQFLLEETVGQAVQSIKDETLQELRRKRYQDAQRAIAQLKTLKVLDISCGSGVFLLAAARCLIEAYHWWNEQLHTIYLQDYAQNMATFQQTGLRYEISPAEVVLQNCIFGIDCDDEAVQITRIGLTLMETACNTYRASQGVSTNIRLTNALSSAVDLDAWLGREPHTRIIVGNPPWGVQPPLTHEALQGYVLARGQYDSYELFIERATKWLRPGDKLGYVVPDSMLHLPQHTCLRQMLLQSYQIDAMVKLGEGVFEHVFRGAVAFSATKTTGVAAEHDIRCRIFVKTERQAVMQQERGIQTLLVSDGVSIAQARFGQNKDVVFDLFTSSEDERVLQTISHSTLAWHELFITGRGVEISKTGAVMACPACGTWQNIPRKQKNGRYARVLCVHTTCGQYIIYEESPHETLIVAEKDVCHTQAIIVGEQLHRYALSGQSYLDISKGPYINYKPPTLYAGEKLLVRKTGRGIYATIDRTGAYTNQVVYIFKLKPDRPDCVQRLRLSYILGVLNSRMMLYYYYKLLGDIEWKSFPYMTQKTIMRLPLRCIDFCDVQQTWLHERIADLVEQVLVSGKPPDAKTDNEIERHVRTLYGVHHFDSSSRIDAELQRISTYGSLLGEQKL